MARSPDYKKQLADAVDKLREPMRLRFAVTGVLAAITYFGVFSPLADQIDKKQKKLKAENQKATLAQDIEFLESQAQQIEDRIPKDADTNEFAQYVLSGVRQRPLGLVRLEPDKERSAGVLKAVVLRLEVTGSIKDLDSLLQWLEKNERVFRVDSVKISAAQGLEDRKLMRLTLLGLNA